jgi:hypothetical protein
MFSYLTAIAFGASSFLYTLFTPLVFLLRLCGIHYYIVCKDDEKTRALTKTLQKTTFNSITLFQCGNFYPSGCFIHWKCAGYYNYTCSFDNTAGEIHIFTSPAYFQTLFDKEKVSISFSDTKSIVDETQAMSNEQSMTIYSRVGSYTHIFYTRLRIDISDLKPRGQQSEVVDSICKTFAEKRRGVFFIHGVSGVGKSTIGLIVANRLNGTFCHTFNPTDPGDTIQILLRETEPTLDHPTIILLEEINISIDSVHNGTTYRHKDITTCINSKSTYNTFFDDLILYKNVVIILTSNESKESIDLMDPCYLRKGRVDEYYSMMSNL